jgi:hypothetical protein
MVGPAGTEAFRAEAIDILPPALLAPPILMQSESLLS